MIGLIVTLIIVGVLLWLVETMIPMDAWMKRVIQIVVIVCVVLYLLSAFGLLGIDMPVPHFGHDSLR